MIQSGSGVRLRSSLAAGDSGHMSMRAALQFIRQVRTDQALKDRIKDLGMIPDLGDILPIGAEAGFNFTVEELRRAHNHDWAMRWVYYGGTDE